MFNIIVYLKKYNIFFRSVEGHLLNALRNNFKNFFTLDKINKNGQVEWEEWLIFFNQVPNKSF